MRRPRQSPSPSPSSVLAVSSSAFLFVLLFVAGAARCADDEGRNLDDELTDLLLRSGSMWPPPPPQLSTAEYGNHHRRVQVPMPGVDSVKRNRFEFLSSRAGKRSAAAKRDQFDFLSGRAGKKKRNGFDFLSGRAGKRSGFDFLSGRAGKRAGGGQFDFLSGRAGKKKRGASDSLDFLSRAGRSADDGTTSPLHALQQAHPLFVDETSG